MSHSQQLFNASDRPRSPASNAQSQSVDNSSVDLGFDDDNSVSDFSQALDANPGSLASNAQDVDNSSIDQGFDDDNISSISDFSIVTGTTSDVLTSVVHGVKYYALPPGDMVYIQAEEQAREWYVVTRGVFVGVFKYAFLVDQATRKVSSAHGKKEDSLRDAVDHFNAARASGWMRICTRPDHVVF